MKAAAAAALVLVVPSSKSLSSFSASLPFNFPFAAFLPNVKDFKNAVKTLEQRDVYPFQIKTTKSCW